MSESFKKYVNPSKHFVSYNMLYSGIFANHYKYLKVQYNQMEIQFHSQFKIYTFRPIFRLNDDTIMMLHDCTFVSSFCNES